MLPAVSSLKALRRVAKPSAATKPMIGFGNPLLDGNQSHPKYGDYKRTGRPRPRQPELPGDAVAAGGRFDRRAARRRPDFDTGRSRRPRTSQGSSALAGDRRRAVRCRRDLKVERKDIRLGARATEREIKRLSAAPSDAARQLPHRAFRHARHACWSAQRHQRAGPDPDAARYRDEEDDGYLSACEIAGLKLDADWVILSACNTAGGAGGERGRSWRGGVVWAGSRLLLRPGASAPGLALGGQLRRDRQADHLGRWGRGKCRIHSKQKDF